MNAHAQPLLAVDHLVKKYAVSAKSALPWPKKAAPSSFLHAVDDVSLAIAHGESVGLVGESGCGKSTLARLIARLIDPTSGAVVFCGQDIGATPAMAFARDPLRGSVQVVFQDPTDSLNPRYSAADTIGEPLLLLGNMGDAAARAERIAELADWVGLARELLTRFPHQLSGGQKARVGIARAIALSPKLLILDEPTAALDVSVQALILNLLADLRDKLGMSYLFVSHDLHVVRLLCHRVIVMYLGKMIESGPSDAIFRAPKHPYTEALIAAIPDIDKARGAPGLPGEPQSPIDPPPTQCRFASRCSRVHDRCRTEYPTLRSVGVAHEAACHLAEEASG
ncbi:MAG TPA: ABC transporter ATP-binding protein [Casimicrobiaceae bacterium]|nr:ABC transporter ATP-binding protein [Casimicrobiaceae bacterium]